jgi:transposase
MPKRYPKDQQDRAVRVALDRFDEYPSSFAAWEAIAPKLGVGFESLRPWTPQAQIDSGQRSGPTSDELAEIRSLKSKVRDLEEANEILKQASIFFARELDPHHR